MPRYEMQKTPSTTNHGTKANPRMSAADFVAGLDEGSHSSIGSYPRFLLMADGEVLCIECAIKERELIAEAAGEPGPWNNEQWTPVAYAANWEDPNLYCAHCEERIESAYAES